MNSQSPQNYTPGLPPAFLDLERRLAGLRDQYERGELNDQVYQAGVQALTVKDDSGTTWWLSGEAGAWQRWDGQRWVRDHPPAVSRAASPQAIQRKRNLRPMAMGCGLGVLLVGLFAGVLFVGGWREYKLMPKIVEGASSEAANVELYTLTDDQLEVVADMGPPQAFTILFYEEELQDGSLSDVRLETWDYYTLRAEYTFINGDFVAEDLLDAELTGEISPIPYRPEQFVAYMTLDEVLTSAGLERYLVVPLEKELVDGGEVYYAGELTFGLKNNELLYIETLALEVTE